MSDERLEENDSPFRRFLLSRDSSRASRDLGLPSGGGRTGHSLPALSSQACVEFFALGFPIPRADFNRIAGVKSFQG
jgi:hypothetical protein